MPVLDANIRRSPNLTGVERQFGPDEIIVSKTDPKGHITYANEVFQRVAEYTEAELLGKAHSIVRHPAMPRCVFRFLWDTIQAGQEIFAYVVNRSRSGAHYWVFAHVTPTLDDAGRIVSYHSSRRCPDRKAIRVIQELYAPLVAIESRYRNPREAWQASLPKLVETLEKQNLTYDEFIFRI